MSDDIALPTRREARSAGWGRHGGQYVILTCVICGREGGTRCRGIALD